MGLQGVSGKELLMSQNSHNQVAYEGLQQEIDRRFPAGHFVAIENGAVLADDATHRQLIDKLRSQGRSPQGMLIVQAGVKYPQSAIIFLGP
jgi:hypothetical protein